MGEGGCERRVTLACATHMYVPRSKAVAVAAGVPPRSVVRDSVRESGLPGAKFGRLTRSAEAVASLSAKAMYANSLRNHTPTRSEAMAERRAVPKLRALISEREI